EPLFFLDYYATGHLSVEAGRAIIAGIAQPSAPEAYCKAIAQLAQSVQVPVLAEALSPVRNYAALNPHLVSTYDLMLRNADLAEKLTPDWVIRVGEMPTSKVLRQWLQQTQPRQWIIDPTDRNLDPLHGKTTHIRCAVEQWAECLSEHWSEQPIEPASSPSSDAYLQLWQTVETEMRQKLDDALLQTPFPFEGGVAWLLSQHLPTGTPLFVANSMPVRDLEFFWQPGNRAIQPYVNRGANGIDGTLSTALGVAHQHHGVLLTGDLALLHDTNGFLISRKFRGHLTIVLINNEGGGIFEALPIAQFDPPFEEFFATPQAVDFSQLCRTYEVAHEIIPSWDHLIQRLNPLPTEGIRLLEVPCNRKADAQTRQQLFAQAHFL
ncbi:MAG: 2-succinyl-5-enolpyruvyl-6-hydroxy-3-cyclohexene-1-carboxylic-acid synthase, partial [Cyanobacteria bacterium RM1_2_2]|nr:2-succinyl-5-enolpyruvyl-6-hydroxy-3-cyclohexene-1-carboxylic-acid synthase [Cyanobacteria bacterium RM1_2_2]